MPPTYAPCLWNVYTSTLEGVAVTNNASEGWHNRFAQMLGRRHPDICSLIYEFKKEQGDTEIGILELGRKIKAAPKKKWMDMQSRLQTSVLNHGVYGVAQILEHL